MTENHNNKQKYDSFYDEWQHWLEKPLRSSTHAEMAEIRKKLVAQQSIKRWSYVAYASAVVAIILFVSVLVSRPPRPDLMTKKTALPGHGIDVADTTRTKTSPVVLTDDLLVIWLNNETPLYMALPDNTQRSKGDT